MIYRIRTIYKTFGEGVIALSKIKNIFSKKLARELVLAVTVSLLIAYLAYEPLSGFGYYLLDKTLMSPSYVKRTEEDFVQKLQSFID